MKKRKVLGARRDVGKIKPKGNEVVGKGKSYYY